MPLIYRVIHYVVTALTQMPYYDMMTVYIRHKIGTLRISIKIRSKQYSSCWGEKYESLPGGQSKIQMETAEIVCFQAQKCLLNSLLEMKPSNPPSWLTTNLCPHGSSGSSLTPLWHHLITRVLLVPFWHPAFTEAFGPFQVDLSRFLSDKVTSASSISTPVTAL